MKKLISIILVIAIVASIGIVFYKFKNKNVNYISKINDYVLYENRSKYYKDTFEELEKLMKKQYSDEEFAVVVSKLFLTDLFSIEYAVDKNDILGIQYIEDSFKDDFKKIVKTTLYNNVETNIYGDRNQELPIVKEVEIKEVTEDTINYKDIDTKVVKVLAQINYKKDLGYQEEATLYLVVSDEKAEIIKMD